MVSASALEYILDADFYYSEKYRWIKPIFNSVMEDSFNNDLIISQIASFFPSYNFKETIEVPKKQSSMSEGEKEKILDIQYIDSVDKICNVGLVDCQTPIKFSKGLNVIYGKNASGKSSIYSAICNTMGISKKILPNLNNEEEEFETIIKAIDKNGEENIIELNNQRQKRFNGIRIFDNEKSAFLIEKDQVNQFELSYLNFHYFYLLNDAFDQLSEALRVCSFHIDNAYNNSRNTLLKIFPDFEEIESEFTFDRIDKITLTKKTKSQLSEYEATLIAISKDNVESTIKNIENAQKMCEKILKSFGETQIIKNDIHELNSRWDFSFPRFISEINISLDKYNEMKKIVDSTEYKHFKSLIPHDWIGNERWEAFIIASLDFVDSIEIEQQKIYVEEKCPYCFQLLSTENGKKLIASYKQIKDETRVKMEEMNSELMKNIEQLESVVTQCIQFPEALKIINDECKTIGIKGKLVFDTSSLKKYITSCVDNIKKHEKVNLNTDLFEKIEKKGNDVLILINKFNHHIKIYNESKDKRDATIIGIKEKSNPLKKIQKIVENKKSIKEYLFNKSNKQSITEKISNVIGIKQSTSALATKFSKEIPLKEFKKHLNDEYSKLGYHPPEYWSIKASTSGLKNKRVYGMKDKKLSEIFSEGEKKIHSIADFLAENEFIQFKGTIIFDDPVSSLDEDRMEYVGNRIHELVREGNQVIVLTHNLVFLNALLDPEKEEIVKLSKSEGNIIIEPEIKLGDLKESKKRKKVIVEQMDLLNRHPDLQVDEYKLRGVYDLISGYLELYVEQVLLKNVINRYRPNVRMNSLNRLNNFDPDEITPIMELFKITSRKGSRHSHPLGSPPPKYKDILHDFESFKKYNIK